MRLWRCRWILLFAKRLPIGLLRAPLLQSRRREEPMDASKYEKSFDNRCAALVSREGSAPRAAQNCKPCMHNRLRLISPLRRARGAQVSRAARGSNRGRDSTTEFSRYRLRCASFPSRGVAGATPSSSRQTSDVTPRHTNVTECHVTKCHTCDIPRFTHKLIPWNGLEPELQSNVIHFHEKRFLL